MLKRTSRLKKSTCRPRRNKNRDTPTPGCRRGLRSARVPSEWRGGRWVVVEWKHCWLEFWLIKRLEITFWFCDMSKLPFFELFISVGSLKPKVKWLFKLKLKPQNFLLKYHPALGGVVRDALPLGESLLYQRLLAELKSCFGLLFYKVVQLDLH